MWGTRGWQPVLGATQSLPIWEACEDYERAILAEEQRLAAQTPTPAAHPRGRKRQAVDNLEHTHVENMLKNLLQHFSLSSMSPTHPDYETSLLPNNNTSLMDLFIP